jgi:hypothetical protein
MHDLIRSTATFGILVLYQLAAWGRSSISPSASCSVSSRVRAAIRWEGVIDWCTSCRPRHRFGTFALALFVLLLLAARAHAQPSNWQSWQQGPTTYYSRTDATGGHWTGKSFLHWGERFFEFTGPDGEVQHCRAYELPGARHTECFP